MISNYKATPGQWQDTERRADNGNTIDIRLLELRSRIEQLEAQANHIGDSNKMVPPTVATDEELDDTWHKTTGGTFLARRRAIYNLGVAHGQASSRDMPEQEAGR